jgi:hypothetical protein
MSEGRGVGGNRKVDLFSDIASDVAVLSPRGDPSGAWAEA